MCDAGHREHCEPESSSTCAKHKCMCNTCQIHFSCGAIELRGGRRKCLSHLQKALRYDFSTGENRGMVGHPVPFCTGLRRFALLLRSPDEIKFYAGLKSSVSASNKSMMAD